MPAPMAMEKGTLQKIENKIKKIFLKMGKKFLKNELKCNI
jgi:hypothetical protein